MSNTSTSQHRSTQKVKQNRSGSYLKGLPLIFFGLVTLLALLGVGYGSFNELLASTLRWLFGRGSYLLALLIGVQGWLVLRGHSWRTYLSWGQLLALELLILCLLGIWTLNSNQSLALYDTILKSSGGLLGWTIAFFVSPFGTTAGKAFLSLCILLLLPPLFKLPLQRIQTLLANQQQKVNAWQSALQLPAPVDQVTKARPTAARQAAPSYSSSARDQNRASRPSAASPAHKPLHKNVRAAGGSAVSATSSLPKWGTHLADDVIPPKQQAKPPLVAQTLATQAPREEVKPISPVKPAVAPAVKTTSQRVQPVQQPVAPPVKTASQRVPPIQQPVAATMKSASQPVQQPVAAAKKEVLPAPAPVRQAPKQQAKASSTNGKKPKLHQAEQSAPIATDIDPPTPPVRKINTIVPVSVAKPRRRDDLPPFEILRQHSGQVDPLEAQEKARLIEETLEHFGVPATVVEINQGPRITQFGVEPGFIETLQRDGTVKRRKVKVNAIKALSDDLALALAARSIRIQSRVPGRTYVGIELPNDEFETVTLHSVLTSQAYHKIKGDLVIALGRDVTGQPVVADISRMPHMLIAGATGSGKSVCINAIIASLLFNLGPEQLKLLLIDPKMVELVPYNGIPHLHMPVVTNMEKVVGCLSWAAQEMERRYNLFSDARKRNLQSYNKWAKSNNQDTLPYVVIIIDELADLMMVAADDVEQIICRLAQMARATGMHLILATQRPSVDVVTGLIKANIPTRISFAVASGTDSRVILDSTGAENLLGLGDMLYQASDASRLQRIQGCYVSDDELQELVDFWLHAKAKKALSQILQQKPPSKPIYQPEATQAAAGQEITPQEEDSDELLAKAIALLEENQSISITMLQRKLRISYTRAARMIKELKKQGVIGAPRK